jgi:multidrug efflux pump subunit AcrA (membrane-fusion protein)
MDVSVAEANIGQIHVGQSATVSIDAITDLELAAKVTSISVLPTSSSGVVSYDVTLELTQSDGRVRPGMSASATIVIAEADNAVTVQSAAISSRGSTSTVTVDDNGKAVVTTVIPGLVGTSATQIVAGLTPGETVEIPITTRLSTAAASTTAGAGLGGLGAGGAGAFPSGGAGGGGGGFRRLFGGGG